MNERIQEIAKVAAELLHKQTGQTWGIHPAVAETFAKLIVKEVVTVMNATAKRAQDQYTYMGDDVPTFAHVCEIRKHFGVK